MSRNTLHWARFPTSVMPLLFLSGESRGGDGQQLFPATLFQSKWHSSQTENNTLASSSMVSLMFLAFHLCVHSCWIAALLEWPDLPFYRQQGKNSGRGWRCLFAQWEGISEKCHDADEAPPDGCTGRKSIHTRVLGCEEGTVHGSRGICHFYVQF